MKIFDCFKFFNELELLDLRIMVLNDIVDYFVLVEANKTHTGRPKEFIFEQNKDKFADYLDKIIYVKVKDLPHYSLEDIWFAENFQRNCITRGLGLAKPTDKIIISDVDEIPNPDVIMQNINTPGLVTMTQKLFYYHVNCLQNQPWWGSVLSTCNWDEWGSPQNLRNKARSGENPVLNGGWHYSFMGGPEKIRIKVENIAESHLIIDGVGSIADIEGKIKTQKDLWNRTDHHAQKQIIDINVEGMSPKCIDKFIEKYPEFFFKNNDVQSSPIEARGIKDEQSKLLNVVINLLKNIQNFFLKIIRLGKLKMSNLLKNIQNFFLKIIRLEKLKMSNLRRSKRCNQSKITSNQTEITDENWDKQLNADKYFDCGRDYAADLIERYTNKEKTALTLEAIGDKQIFDIEKEGKDWDMLEIGCGYGLYAAHFCQFIKNYIGVDVSNYIVKKGNEALQKAQINNAELFVIPSCDLSLLEDNCFDFIFTGAVFIHIDPYLTISYVKQTYDLLKPDGKFLYHFYMTEGKSIHETNYQYYDEVEFNDIFNHTKLKIIDIKDHYPSEGHPFYPDKYFRYVYGGRKWI